MPGRAEKRRSTEKMALREPVGWGLHDTEVVNSLTTLKNS